MLKGALLKAEILSTAKNFHVCLSFFKIESLSGNLVHNSRKSWGGGRGEAEFKKEEERRKRNVILN